MDKTQRCVVGGILISSERALIVRRSLHEQVLPGVWELPSGKVRYGEHPHSALRREFLEETGLTVDPIVPVCVFDYFVRADGSERHNIQIDFLVKGSSGEAARLSTAHSEFRWIAREDIDGLPSIDEVIRTSLRRAFDINSMLSLR